MFEIQPAPSLFDYDARGIFYFEIYPNGIPYEVSSSINDIDHKDSGSLYGSYFRVKNNECNLYLSAHYSETESVVYRVDDIEALADAFGIIRDTNHVHDIHAAFSSSDDGTGRYAEIDIEFRCGCTLSSHNCRIVKKYLREKYGWEIVLGSIGFEPLTKRTISVERKSLSKTTLPF